MSGLSSELQQLVNAGISASRPTLADSERVLRGLEARLGLAVGTAGIASIATGYGVPSGALTTRVLAKVGAGLGLAVAGFVLVHTLSREVATNDLSTKNTAVSAAVSSEASNETTTSERQDPSLPNSAVIAPENRPASASTPATSREASRPSDTLSEEVAILSRAEKELHSGHAENALRLLKEHERKYRKGKLAEERTAARIQALCALGRFAEANALLGSLAPQSLHGKPAHRACSKAENSSTAR
jgi:hypothetical protein